MLVPGALNSMLLGAVAPVSVVFTDSSVDPTDLTVYTFSAQALGVASPKRKIVVGVSLGLAARTVTSLTVQGISATLVRAQAGAGVIDNELWQANVPAGTTGDIVVTCSAASDRAGIGVWAVYNAASAAFATAGSAANPLSASLNIPQGGIAIGVGSGYASPLTYTWANLTENYDEVVEANMIQTGASAFFAAAQTGLVITATPAGGITDQSMALASWGPL